MLPPQHFAQKLEKYQRFKLEANDADEARQMAKDCIRIQRELRVIKKEIGAEVTAIRSEYRERVAHAASKDHLLWGAVFGRRSAGSLRADSKRALANERDRVIAPYTALKSAIDDLIAQLERGKNDARDNVEASKAASRKEQKIVSELEQLERLADLKDRGHHE